MSCLAVAIGLPAARHPRRPRRRAAPIPARRQVRLLQRLLARILDFGLSHQVPHGGAI
jgi:hypothetical protein